MITFDELKQKVSIIQIAEDLGYRLKKKDGTTNPCYALYIGDQKVDEILVKNPNNTYRQRFCDRNYHHGDVVEFVKLHLNSFQQFHHKNENIMISIVLKHYARIPYVPKEKISFSLKKIFSPERYETKPATIENCKYLAVERNLSSETIETFSKHIRLIRDTKSKKGIWNIGFPYREPGKEEITNYEIRNKGFKSMAVGGDASRSVWGVFSRKVDNLFIFESAIDAMSFYELKKEEISFNHTALVSTGGGLSNNQVLNIIRVYKPIKIICCFDNDTQGLKYYEKTKELIGAWNIREDSNIQIDIILPNDKDFNDELKNTKL